MRTDVPANIATMWTPSSATINIQVNAVVWRVSKLGHEPLDFARDFCDQVMSDFGGVLNVQDGFNFVR
ncbi:hypothetical protein HJB89_10910 [Rhizobium sp. NZLR8]|uniref:hypothetical protein n=1 Tax=Rhizobium sp. NZLR8 TaxID=2731104 RepID=UPI001C838D25|nr:hypothetical protein [Rhizobium sp. NZLR8]MBX5157634.1 hypothetical protein [Rhizobium sp. NZLR8]